MKVFFGAAIQAHQTRGERSNVYAAILDAIKKAGCSPISEHAAAQDPDETARALEAAFGKLPPPGIERRVFVRDRLIDILESDVEAAVFEVSTPSLGTGVELAHAYLRSRLGLRPIPILALYQKDFWPNGLSTMVAGIRSERVPHLQVREYRALSDAQCSVEAFLKNVKDGAKSMATCEINLTEKDYTSSSLTSNVGGNHAKSSTKISGNTRASRRSLGHTASSHRIPRASTVDANSSHTKAKKRHA